MILTGEEIRQAVDNGDITITPFNENNINPNSYDLTLDKKVTVLVDKRLDLAKKPNIDSFEIDTNGWLLVPGELYLMQTLERTATSMFVPCIEGRSSIGRMGINIHATAGFGDVGFDGTWTLEVSVIKPVRIYAGVKIGQIYFMHTNWRFCKPYAGKYLGQDTPRASEIYKEKDSWIT